MVFGLIVQGTSTLDSPRCRPDQKQRLFSEFGIGANSFSAVLIGKDGGEKLRVNDVPDLQAIYAVIDGMPMRGRDEAPTQDGVDGWSSLLVTRFVGPDTFGLVGHCRQALTGRRRYAIMVACSALLVVACQHRADGQRRRTISSPSARQLGLTGRRRSPRLLTTPARSPPGQRSTIPSWAVNPTSAITYGRGGWCFRHHLAGEQRWFRLGTQSAGSRNRAKSGRRQVARAHNML